MSTHPHHKAKAISVWGTSSNVGKSLLCAGLGRWLSNQGYKTAPFKAQTMSNNSAVTQEGGEIGRAQACQAEACRIPVINDLNPLLLKPTGDQNAQVILHGKMKGVTGSAFGMKRIHEFKRAIAKSYNRLASTYDVVLIEGAGGCAELNLRRRDLANEWITNYADAKVILVADIERGGVFASLFGSLDLLTPASRARVIGLVINKFRGAPELFEEGIKMIEERSGLPVLGVLPFIKDHHLPDEDGASFQSRTIPIHSSSAQPASIRVGVVMTSHISNSTDIEALIADGRFDVTLLYKPADQAVDLFVIPGSKNVIEDLVHLKNKGFTEYLTRQRKAGKMVIGICGGYQMLGTVVQDPLGVESNWGACEGFGFIPAETTLMPQKISQNIKGTFLHGGFKVAGYEIHCGKTVSTQRRPLIEIHTEQSTSCRRFDGVMSDDGRVWGTYIHGLFDSVEIRDDLAQRFGLISMHQNLQPDIYEPLALVLRECLNLDGIINHIES